MEIKMTQQAIRSQQKKQMIYETTMKLFETYGYQQTTIKDICTAAEITSGTFYNFYGDKRSILLEYRDQMISNHISLLSPAPAHIAAPFQSICDYFYDMLCSYDRIPKSLSCEIHSEYLGAYLSDREKMMQSSPHEPMIQLLTCAIQAGVLKPGTNPQQTTEYLLSAIVGLMEFWHYFSTGETMCDLAKRMLPMIFSAITDQPVQLRTTQDN